MSPINKQQVITKTKPITGGLKRPTRGTKRRATQELPNPRKHIKLKDLDYKDEEEEVYTDDEFSFSDEDEQTQIIDSQETVIFSDEDDPDEDEPHEDEYREKFEEEYAKIDQEKRITFWKSIIEQVKNLQQTS